MGYHRDLNGALRVFRALQDFRKVVKRVFSIRVFCLGLIRLGIPAFSKGSRILLTETHHRTFEVLGLKPCRPAFTLNFGLGRFVSDKGAFLSPGRCSDQGHVSRQEWFVPALLGFGCFGCAGD